MVLPAEKLLADLHPRMHHTAKEEKSQEQSGPIRDWPGDASTTRAATGRSTDPRSG